MIKIENLEVFNLVGAVRGLRNPYDSWAKSDSEYDWVEDNEAVEFCLGEADLKLMQKLRGAGPVHGKFMRQILCCFDIVAPLYFYKEFDTYKVGTTSNSCSTMHCIHTKDFTLEDFSCEHLNCGSLVVLEATITELNMNRELYNKTKDKEYWWQMIQLLPSTYNQRRTITCSYENLANMIEYRSNHKLDEWQEFCEYMLDNAPYLASIMGRKADNGRG